MGIACKRIPAFGMFGSFWTQPVGLLVCFYSGWGLKQTPELIARNRGGSTPLTYGHSFFAKAWRLESKGFY
jgi:hypothetical protein